jgi:MerR family transcriptional regulator, copper efflux regulator
MEVLHIGELARQAGVSVETVRYYERRGLLAPPPRSTSGYREYGSAEVDQLRFIGRAKTLGFTLAEIAALLASGTEMTTASVEVSARRKLAALDEERRHLEQTSERLQALVELCSSDDAACVDLNVSC